MLKIQLSKYGKYGGILMNELKNMSSEDEARASERKQKSPKVIKNLKRFFFQHKTFNIKILIIFFLDNIFLRLFLYTLLLKS